jgi:hypothetical protein
MDRRQVLQMGVALAALPLASCGASAIDPKATPVVAANAPGKALVDDPIKAMDHAPAAPADHDAAASPAAEKGAEAVKDAPVDDALKSSFSRVIGRLGRNHGHALTVSFDDVKAGAEKTYNLVGAADHPHAVTLSPADMKSLLGGTILRTKSTTERGHAHRVVVRCAPPVEPPEWVNACKFSSSGRDEHEIVITAADLAAKVEKTYDIQGLAGHAHQVTLSAADFQKLAINGPVTLHSTRDPDDAHLHTVTIESRRPAKT